MLCPLLLVPTLAFLRYGGDPKPQQTTIDVGLDAFLQNLTRAIVANTTGSVGANETVPTFEKAAALPRPAARGPAGGPRLAAQAPAEA